MPVYITIKTGILSIRIMLLNVIFFPVPEAGKGIR